MRRSILITRALLVIAISTITISFSGCDLLSGKTNLTVSVVGSGNVTLSPSGGKYEPGTTVTITVTPDSGFVFYGYEGDVVSTNITETVTIGEDNLNVTAYMPIYMYDGSEGRVIVKAETVETGSYPFVAFTVDLAMDDSAIDIDDGFNIWIRPYTYSSQDTPAGQYLSHYWRASDLLPASSTDIIRGGGLRYSDSDGTTITYNASGTIDDWNIEMCRYDASANNGSGSCFAIINTTFSHEVIIE